MLKPKSLTQVLVSVFLIRLLVTGASIGDALVIIALSGLYALYMHIESNIQPEANQDIRDRLKAVEDKAANTDTKMGALTLRR